MSPSRNVDPSTHRPVESWSQLAAAARRIAGEAIDVSSEVSLIGDGGQGIFPLPEEQLLSGPKRARRALEEAAARTEEESPQETLPKGITIGGLKRLREQQGDNAK
jgi:hypothetical protein